MPPSLRQYEEARQDIAERFETEKVAAEQEMQNAQWEATTIAEAARGGSGVQLKEIQAQLESRWQELQTIHRQAVALLNRWGQWHDFVDPQPVSMLLERHPVRRFCHALDMARTQYHALASLFMPRLVQGLRPMGIVLLLWAVMTVPAGALFGWNNIDYWVMASAATSYLPLRFPSACRSISWHGGGVPITTWPCGGRCWKRAWTAVPPWRWPRATANGCWRPSTPASGPRSAGPTRSSFAAMGASLAQRERETAEIEATYPPRLAAIQAARDQVLQQAETKYPSLLMRDGEPLPGPVGRLPRDPPTGPRCRQTPARAGVERDGPAMERRRRPLRRSGGSHPQELRAAVSRLGAADAPSWTPPSETPAAVRFGQINVQLAKIRGGIPDDPRLKPPATEFTLPLLLPLPDHSLFLLKAGETGRPKAIESLQACDAAAADLHAARQDPLHDFRPGRPGRELFRLHAPGRLRRATRVQPHLDRFRSHRAAAGRPDAAHGERDPGLPPQRISNRSWNTTPSPARWPNLTASW